MVKVVYWGMVPTAGIGLWFWLKSDRDQLPGFLARLSTMLSVVTFVGINALGHS